MSLARHIFSTCIDELCLCVAGHVHAYERTFPVYNYTVNKCGTVHITIGDGGNSEGISFLDNYTNKQQRA
jgi:hypothetical protein